MSQPLGFDRRRINGPEESKPPVLEPLENSLPLKVRQGRKPTEIRPIFLKTGLISQANGSAYIETEKTKIVCAVYGPRQSRNTPYNENGKLNVEVKFTPFSCPRRRTPMRDAEDRSLSLLIHQSLLPSLRLELFPKSSIDVFVTVLENDGLEGCVAAGSTAASTALADAGIEMLGLVIGCSACTIAKPSSTRDEIWLDPDTAEVGLAKGAVTLACIPALGQVTNVWQTGQMGVEELNKCLEECQARCKDIHFVVAEALLESPNAQALKA